MILYGIISVWQRLSMIYNMLKNILPNDIEGYLSKPKITFQIKVKLVTILNNKVLMSKVVDLVFESVIN